MGSAVGRIRVIQQFAAATVAVIFAVATTMAQTPKQSVAVYMAGTEPAPIKGAHKVLGAELAKALAKSGNFTAVDRTDEVIKVLSAADIFRKDGAIDIDKAKKAGTQLGAQMLCVAEISEVMQSYFLEARIVNIKTAELSNVATTYGDLISAEAVVQKAQAVAMELVGGKKKIVDYTYREIEANPDKVIKDYIDAIRQEPNVADYYFKRGVAYQYKNEHDKAIADFTEAIKLAPKEAWYFVWRGSSHKSKKSYDQAIADCNQAIQLNPNEAEAYIIRGIAYYQKEDYDQAIADFSKTIRLNPNHADAYHFRGNAYNFGKGDYDRAIADYSKAIRLNPNYAFAYCLRGLMYKYTKNYAKAIADFEAYLRFDPNDSDAKNYIAEIRRLQGRK